MLGTLCNRVRIFELLRTAAWLAAASVTACGGGGGASGTTAEPLTSYPVFVASGNFVLPELAAPPERATAADRENGRIVDHVNSMPESGALVELLDGRVADAPIVLASARTLSDGTFSVVSPAGTKDLPPQFRWLRARLSSGTILRAYATGWAEISPGSEAEIQEAERLRIAGAWGARDVSVAELAAAQDTVGLVWRKRHGTLPSAEAVVGMVNHLRARGSWSRVVASWQQPVPASLGDLAGLAQLPAVKLEVAVDDSSNGKRSASLVAECVAQTLPTNCGMFAVNEADLSEEVTLTETGVAVVSHSSDASLSRLRGDIDRLPLVEFPHRVGTRVIWNTPRFDVRYAPELKASIRVVRRTYDMEEVQALGGAVQALPVILDYEISTYNTSTKVQTDFLVREKRWLMPDVGTVRKEVTRLVRAGSLITTRVVTGVARAAIGVRDDRTDLPAAGVADVEVRALRHMHAVYSAATAKVYVAVDFTGWASETGRLSMWPS